MGCAKHDDARKAQAPLKVNTMVVTSQAGSATSRYVGTIEPAHETPLSIHASGRVVNVYATNGQRVRKGQTLVQLEDTQERNALEAAEATLKHAQDGYNRAKQVHEKGVITDQKMVEIESELTQAKSLYATAKQRLDECTLIAPCEGVVNGLNIEKGQSVIPGTRVCSILDISGFSVRFTVPESEINTFRASKKELNGEVECPAVEKSFPIVVKEKSVTANPLTHTYDVVARIQGDTDLLMTGMVGIVKVNNHQSPITDNQSNIVIPARCVLLNPKGHTVWLMNNGEAVRRDIRIGGYEADGVRVEEGLLEGDTLIIDGYQKLYNGCKVIENQ